eukprot:CAMPEP_0201734362 /NCGR_PEP_ID=MMETSP0593-20130828/34053_1 /ASSEMBLY_ACC=CAM_ASM_000672 /TAXON_ID=267983 /ORGANISM="Skeletonema japonicum, Strain CCMP2506" /LENGTH=200 /DNA_ID=CAMNT_0048227671 /DNA_START=216 /DNA_END=815 /DNA_ORIENTATION=-
MSGSWNRLKPSKTRSSRAMSSSKTSNSMDSGSPSLSDTPPSSPPPRLLRVVDGGATTTTSQQQQPTTISVEFPRGSERMMFSRGSSTSMGPPTVESNSSMDSVSTGITHSPSSTPPKKTWERNYKSFLKKSGGRHPNTLMPAPAMLPAPRMSSDPLMGGHKRSSAPSISINSEQLGVLRKAAEMVAVESGDVEFGDDDWT